MERDIHTYTHTDKVTWFFFLRMRLLASPFGLAINKKQNNKEILKVLHEVDL
jgi:hypothetical protein